MELNVAIFLTYNIYSSSKYISQILQEMGRKTIRISGIPAFIECASRANIHVASGDVSLEIVPTIDNVVLLKEKLEARKNIVVMKLSQSEAAIKQLIRENDNYRFHYFENVGVADSEYYSCNAQEIILRRFPYFSTMIIIKKEI